MLYAYRVVNIPNVGGQTLDAALDQLGDALEQLCSLFCAGTTGVKHGASAPDDEAVVSAEHEATQYALVRRESRQRRFDLGGRRRGR